MNAPLARVYFAVNSLLYLGLAMRNSLAPDRFRQAIGWSADSPAARAEFLATYGGMIFALAMLFADFCIDSSSFGFGLRFCIVFYAVLVLYRIVPPLYDRARYSFLAGSLIPEALLLTCAVVLMLHF